MEQPSNCRENAVRNPFARVALDADDTDRDSSGGQERDARPTQGGATHATCVTLVHGTGPPEGACVNTLATARAQAAQPRR